MSRQREEKTTATTTPRWHPPVAITTSRLLLPELRVCEQHAGTEFVYPVTIPEARRLARRAPMIVIGADQAGLIRKPILCRNGLVIVGTADPTDRRAYAWTERIGAQYVMVLPDARAWLVDKLLDRSDRGGPAAPVRR